MTLAAKPIVHHQAYRKGDVFFADLREGFAQEFHGIRPAVIVQSNLLNRVLNTVAVAPITSSENVFTKDYPSQLHIDGHKYSNKDFWTIRLEAIRPVNKILLKNKIATLDDEDLKRLDAIIMRNLDLGKEQEGKGMNELVKIEHLGQRVLTTAQLAEKYETESKRISENFNRNFTHYNEGTHFYLLTGQALKEFKGKYANCGFAENLNQIYLWTEKGCLLHAKSLGTDKAWQVYEMLVDTYFRVKELIAPKSPAELIAAGYKAALDMIEEMKPKALSFDSLMSADGLYTIADAAKVLNFEGIGPKKIFEILQSEGFLFKRGNWHAKQSYIDFGYFTEKTRPVDFGSANTEVYTQVFVTPKGLDMLDKHFSRNGFKKNPMAVNQ